MPRPVHVIGVPLDMGGSRRGVDMGPSAFRIAGLSEKITALRYTVADKGDLPSPIPETRKLGDPNKKFIRDIAKVCDKLYQTVRESLEEGALPLVLGGDHSLAAGSVAASAAHARGSQQSIGLLWIDAHGDMNTPASTPSGNVHGMPLAALLGPEPAELSSIGGFSPTVLPEHTALVGVRNLDEREKVLVRNSGVHVFTMKDIDRLGVAAVATKALEAIGKGTGGLHVSFDLDACDPAIAPGVGTPVRGGLNYREAHLLMELIAETGRLTALDLVEVNPTLDLRNTTAELGVELALSALGMKIL
ncbi:MAG: arginase [Vicinamibacterales bacterium]|nr:arginase [Vicinamibacterales bacterium]